MATATDYKLSDTFDLVIGPNGDFQRTASDQQASILLFNTNQGAWKQHALCGIGIKKYKGSSGTDLIMKREITVQHVADGFRVNRILVKDFEFYLDIERDDDGN